MMSFSLDTTTPLSFRDTRIAGKFYLIQIYALTHFFGGTLFYFKRSSMIQIKRREGTSECLLH